MPENYEDIEGDIRLKIEIVRLLKNDSPIDYIRPDDLYFLKRGLDSDIKDEIFQCQSCKLIMTQPVELSCGCCVCRKCLQQQSIETVSRSMYQSFVSDDILFCPVCDSKVSYINQLSDIQTFTRKFTFKCPYEKCKFSAQYDDLLAHMQFCDFGQLEMQKNIEPYILLLQEKERQLQMMRKQLQEQEQYIYERPQHSLQTIPKLQNSITLSQFVTSPPRTHSFTKSNQVVLQHAPMKYLSCETVKEPEKPLTIYDITTKAKEMVSIKEQVKTLTQKLVQNETSRKSEVLKNLKINAFYQEMSNDITKDLNMFSLILSPPLKTPKINPMNTPMQKSVKQPMNSSVIPKTPSALQNAQMASKMAQLKNENDKLKQEVAFLKKNPLVQQKVVFEYPEYISSLDFDISVLTLIRYIFYGNNNNSSDLQQLCSEIRQNLFKAVEQDDYSQLLQFVAIIFEFYAEGEHDSENYKQMQNIIGSKLQDSNLKTSNALIQKLKNRKNFSEEFHKIELGGAVMKNEFGVEARIWMLKYIQDLKRIIKDNGINV
ncbi:Conserved_hypothetical protein [Hexamita inflata]|uniref:Uncharacterized protein n=1 Tax=Hexamita inflata TaxID=28002 RepID=A0AA86QTL8_9EUKA|nr:Conserved hypothetical protein [Hexamita inflata]CAI9957665.1 Conserved hypothetical protein [Hexamita inflata]CAI9963718.1 Conserved hypothetical protein [Hexamita inflata]CAI9964550.1 Conserved hypothetical protein [Hexamita inflata]